MQFFRVNTVSFCFKSSRERIREYSCSDEELADLASPAQFELLPFLLLLDIHVIILTFG